MRAKMLFAIIALFFATVFSLPTFADDTDSKAVASAFANDLGHKALAVLSDKSSSKEEKMTELETLFEANVDINWIGKFVLGRNWKTATDEQKKAYLENYKTFLIKHYTSNLNDFADTNFEVTKVAIDERGGNIVTMRIKRPGAEDIVVDYTIRKSDSGGLKVYDINVEGVSMITTQRSDFSSVVSQNGLDYLIQQLADRSKKEDAPAQ